MNKSKFLPHFQIFLTRSLLSHIKYVIQFAYSNKAHLIAIMENMVHLFRCYPKCKRNSCIMRGQFSVNNKMTWIVWANHLKNQTRWWPNHELISHYIQLIEMLYIVICLFSINACKFIECSKFFFHSQFLCGMFHSKLCKSIDIMSN